MSIQVQPASQPGRRVQIRNRTHARELACGIAFGPLFQNGGTVEGFADWLFVNRKTFNGSNPLQQVSVYANRYQRDKRRGIDFDVVCRSRADQLDEAIAKAKAAFEADVSAIEMLWTKTIDGPCIAQATAALCLGRGSRFADSPEGDALPAPPSWALEGLLHLLTDFGGPDDVLDEFPGKQTSAENHFREMTPILDKSLTKICKEIGENQPPSEWDFRSLACTAGVLARLSRVRTMLRCLLTQVQMVERIEASASDAQGAGPAPERRRREV